MSRLAALVAVLGFAAVACTSGDADSIESDAAPVTTSTAADTPSTTTIATTPPSTTPPPSTTQPSTTQPSTTRPSTTPPAPAPVAGAAADDLILVQRFAGGDTALSLYSPAGEIVASLPTTPGTVPWLPTWAPSGRRIAWAETPDQVNYVLLTSNIDGSEVTRTPLVGRPDYLAYDPTSSFVILLTPAPDGFGLTTVDVADGGTEIRQLDIGQPYFADMSPTGDRFVAHVDTQTRIVDSAGAYNTLDDGAAAYQAPAWHPTDDVVVYVTTAPDHSSIVVHDLGSDTATTIATFNGFVWFGLSPDGNRLAVSVVEAADQSGTESTAESEDQSTGALTGGLWDIDVATGSATQLSERPSVGPMWDPTSSRILARGSASGIGTWEVFDLEGGHIETEPHSVDNGIIPNYLRFWDQFVHAGTLWSPDGTRFVYSGGVPDQAGIWVHDADTSGSSTFLAPGDNAFWSPT